MRGLLAAVAVTVAAAAGCTSAGHSAVSTQTGEVTTGDVRVQVVTSPPPSENVHPGGVAAAHGLISSRTGYLQHATMRVGQSRTFELFNTIDYYRPLALYRSKPGIVTIRQHGGYPHLAPVIGTITATMSGTVTLSTFTDAACFHDKAGQACERAQAEFTLRLRVTP